MWFVVFGSLIVLGLAANTAVSVFIWKKGVVFSRQQKIYQIILVWLVPVIGSLIAYLFLKTQLEKNDWEPDSAEVIAARNLESQAITYAIGASQSHRR